MAAQSGHELDMTLDERDQRVARSVYLIQHAQYSLSLQEQRFLLYCISKVRPDDTEATEYSIEIKDYLNVCGLRGTTTYASVKKIITDTFKKMILSLEDETKKYIITTWFDYIACAPGDGSIQFKFGSKVAKYLIGLAQYNAQNKNKLYYISDELKFMLPFSSRYSYYLYPLLRSYQNRNDWTFRIDELRQLLDVYERPNDPLSTKTADRKPLYLRYPDFRRNVLDPAIKDINEFSNIQVVYQPKKKGRAIESITFYFESKRPGERIKSEQRGRLILDRDDEMTALTCGRAGTVVPPIVFFEAAIEGQTIPPSVREKTQLSASKAKGKPQAAAQNDSELHGLVQIQQLIKANAETPIAAVPKVGMGKHAPRKRKKSKNDEA